MVIAALCHVCGKPALRSCASCGRATCEDHLGGGRLPVCDSCRAGRRGPMAPGL